MRTISMLFLAAALLISLASCSYTESPPAPSQSLSEKSGAISGTETSKVSITGLYFNPCIPELVAVTGDLHTVISKTQNNDGSLGIRSKFYIKGSGTGRVTGDKYNLIAHTDDEFEYTAGPPYPYTRSFERTIKLVSSGSSSNATLTLTIELTVSSTGSVTSKIISSGTDCQ